MRKKDNNSNRVIESKQPNAICVRYLSEHININSSSAYGVIQEDNMSMAAVGWDQGKVDDNDGILLNRFDRLKWDLVSYFILLL